MAHLSELSSLFPRQWLSPNPSDKRGQNSKLEARRSASSTQLWGSIGLKSTENERQIVSHVSPVSVIVTKPDGDESAPENGGISRLDPRRLHARPSSTVLGQQRWSSTSSRTTRSLDQQSATDMSSKLHGAHSSSTLNAYYSPKSAPPFISQQTSASSSRDRALRKRHPDVAETGELGQVSPNPSVASFHLSEDGLLSKSKFYKKKPPQLDLSLLFPKPQPSAGGLLSPDKLVHSPLQLSPVSETSSPKDALGDAWQNSRPLRKALSKESVKSRDYPLEESQSPEENLRKGSTKWDLQNLQQLLKRKVFTDVRSEAPEEDFVQRLAQNIQEQRPKVPKSLGSGCDYFQYQNQNQNQNQNRNRKKNSTNEKSMQKRAVPAPGPACRQDNSVQHRNSSGSGRKTSVLKKTGTLEESARQRAVPSPGPTSKSSDSIRPCSSSGSGRKTIASKKSGGSVFSRSDLREQSVLELSSSGDEGEVFDDCLGVETGDDLTFLGKLEKSPWRGRGSTSSQSSYYTAKAEQMSRGSQKSNMMITPKSIRRCVSFLRPEEPQDGTEGGAPSARLRSWLTEITPPASPESSSHTGSVLTMAVSQEERDLLKAMRKKRAMLLGRLRTDFPVENLNGGLVGPNPIESPESSIWLPIEHNSPRRTGQRLSTTKSFPSLRNEYPADGCPTPLLSPPKSSRRIRHAPSFVRTNSPPSPPSSEPSPVTPPTHQTTPGQMINCLLSASTSPSSTLYERKHVPKPGSKIKNSTFLEPGTPATPLLDGNGRTPMTERYLSSFISTSTSSASTQGTRSKHLGGRITNFDRLVPENEEYFYASEGPAFSDPNRRIISHKAR